jgi:hypothetical protein
MCTCLRYVVSVTNPGFSKCGDAGADPRSLDLVLGSHLAVSLVPKPPSSHKRANITATKEHEKEAGILGSRVFMRAEN